VLCFLSGSANQRGIIRADRPNVWHTADHCSPARSPEPLPGNCHADGQVETHALWVANPPDGRPLPGPPLVWPHMLDWEEGFDIDPDEDGLCDEDRYTEIHPYSAPRAAG